MATWPSLASGSHHASSPVPESREHPSRAHFAAALSEAPQGRAGQSSVAVGGASCCHTLSKRPVHWALGGTPPPPACGTCGWARDLCWVQPRGRGGLRQGSTAQPGPTRTHAGISHDAGISLRCCVRRWGPWPVTEGMLALGPSPVRAGSPRTGRPPPLVLPVPTETGPCPRAWLTGRSAHTCVRLCAAPRAGWLGLVLRVPASLLRSLPLSPVSPRTRVTPGRPLRSCDTDAQRGNSAGPNLNPSPQVQALPDPGWDQRPSSPD